jgi:hypothetical protein
MLTDCGRDRTFIVSALKLSVAQLSSAGATSDTLRELEWLGAALARIQEMTSACFICNFISNWRIGGPQFDTENGGRRFL